MTERTGRFAAPAAIVLFVVIGIAATEQSTMVAVTAGLVAAATCIVLAVRSVRGWALVCGLTIAVAGITVICNGSPSNLGWFAVCVLAGWAALVGSTRQSVIFGGAVVVMLCVQLFSVNDDAGGGAWIAGTVFTTVVCALARRQQLLLDQLREAQAGLAERSRAEERNRIAGEMHDVIGHALTVSLLHVTSARLALDEDPDEARASLAEAERLGQQSLAEVRQAVGLLRDQGARTTTPKPDAAQVPELVESFRRAGLDVSLEIEGDLDTLTAGAGLTVYRIVQEALTNVARHAPSARGLINIQALPDQTRLTIEDDGGGKTVRDGDGSGVGVINMRERAEAAGGRLRAGPTSAGWQVEAVLPTTRAEAG